MHKGIILLTKPEPGESALNKVREFLKEYKEDVWDWYQIGGRWQSTLSPYRKAFGEKSSSLLEPNEHGFISQKTVDDNQVKLQQLWESLGATGFNPHSDHYKMDNDGGDYDILPLGECIDIVRDWQQTLEDAKKELEDANRYLTKGGAKSDNYNMFGYCLRIASSLFQQNFSSECNVFNIEEYNFSIPDSVDGYFAVMVDIHS